MNDEALDALITANDLDGLVRLIDARTAAREWEALLRLRDRCRAAVSTGRQLWPAASLAEYRLALWAPVEWAVRVLDEGSGRFTPGPLSEVAAQHHTWAELAPLLDDPIRASFVAHERALRGETIDGDIVNALDIPFALQAWEPEYQLAEYKDQSTEFPAPPPVARPGVRVALPDDADLIEDDLVDEAIRQLLDAWSAGSNGKVTVTAVEGSAQQAVAALGVRNASLTELTAAEALAWLGWAGAVGGAHGRRRGAAHGRFAAWWLLAAFGGVVEDWPVDPDELGTIAASLRWYWFDADEPGDGWHLHLAIEHPDEGIAWAIDALDKAVVSAHGPQEA